MKKGIAEYAVIFWSYIAFILLVVLFVLLFAAAKGCSKTPEKQEIIDQLNLEAESNTLLLNYLRTPADPNKPNPKVTVADLVLAGIKANEFSNIEPTTDIIKNYFEENYNECCWKLTIAQDTTMLKEFKGKSCKGGEKKEVKTTIAIPSENKIATVGLQLYTQRHITGGYEIDICTPK